MKCPKCKKQLRENARFCPACGARVEKKRGIRFTSVLLVITMVLGISAIGLGGGILLAKSFGSGIQDLLSGKDSIIVHNAEEAIAHAKELGREQGYENALSELTEKATATIDGDSYYRLQQNYQGIPVHGRTVVYATDQDGYVTSITSNLLDVDSQIVMTPSVTYEEAFNSINAYVKEYLELNNEWIRVPQLSSEDIVIYAQPDSPAILAYRLTVYVGPEAYQVIVGAQNATVYEANLLTLTDSAVVGYSLAPDEKVLNLNICTDNNEFSFYDEVRNIELYSAHGENLVKYFVFYDSNNQVLYYFYPDFDKNGRWLNPAREVIKEPESEYAYFQYGFETTEQINGVTSISASALNNLPQSAYQTMAYLANTYDFLLESLGRHGYANDHTKSLPVVYDCSNGSYSLTYTGVSMVSLETGAGLDVAAHEIMHSVEQCESVMRSSGESGAIMEALSDIFGELSEAYYYRDCDWLHNGGIRNIIRPASSTEANLPHPSTYMGDDWFDTSNPSDRGGVHINSTVISRAAYLMWGGEVGQNSNPKISYTDLSKLWYRAMLMMPSDCNFIECRTLVELAASNMNLTDLQKQCVSEAFDTVEIPRASEEEYLQLVHLLIADGDTSIKGTVYEKKTVNGVETIVPVNKATVTVYSSDSNKVHEKIDIKKDDGKFEIKLPAGTYSVAITAEGYIGQTISFELSDYEVRYLSVELKPDKQGQKADAYTIYQNAAKKTMESGSWSEKLIMTANMAITDGSAKTKTKINMTSDADVSNYSENDPSLICITGSAEMTVMGQTYAWDMEYENGTAHYRYTKPTQSTADVRIDPGFFNFGTMTSDMMSDAKISGNRITFRVPGEKIAEVGIAAVSQMSGVDDLQYGDVDVTVTISNDGRIDNVIMEFHASLEYQGFDAAVDYHIDYRFSRYSGSSGKPVSGCTGNLQEHLDFSKSWGIRKDVTTDANLPMEQVYDFAFMADGTVYCFFYQQYTDFLYGDQGTFTFENNQIQFRFENNDGTSTEYTYSFDPDERKLTQVSEEGLWNSSVGTEYQLTNDEWFPTAQDVIDSAKRAMEYEWYDAG